MGELADVAELDETALSEAQAADQVERDRRHADASSEPSEQSEREEDRAEFDQCEGGCVHAPVSRWPRFLPLQPNRPAFRLPREGLPR